MPNLVMPRGPLLEVASQPQMRRKMRRPRHNFQLRYKPFVIQPFMIAPVIPGETLKNLLLQARTVTDPIKNKLLGWWNEYYFFYVKHRDLTQAADAGGLTVSEELQAMVLDPTWSNDNIDAAADFADLYIKTGDVRWAKFCLERVVEEYFRNEGEAHDIVTVTQNAVAMPVASINGNSWLDSVTNEDAVTQGGTVDTGDGTGATTAESLDIIMQQYEFMKQMDLTQMSYEDWLKSFGVRGPTAAEQHRPELLRYLRDWAYPANTVEPTTGVPSSAVSWATADRADKDRLFKEPGFIFGVTVCRPKVYLSKQKTSAVSTLDHAFAWLPAMFHKEGFPSLREYANSAGPLQGEVTDGYWVDVRDLYLYGDQFVNFVLDEANGDALMAAGSVALPTAALNKRYPSATDIGDLFVDQDAGTGENDPAQYRWVRSDGVVSLNIATSIREFTPSS